VIDCDLWGFKPRIRDVAPYLSSSWREWLRLDEPTNPNLGVRVEVPESQYFVAGSAIRSLSGMDEAVNRTLEHLDRAGLSGAILNPGAASSISGMNSGMLAADLATAVNDCTVERWLGVDDRLRGSIVISGREPARAAAEIRRLGTDSRMVQVLLAYPPYLLGHRAMFPIYEAALEFDLPVNLQAGGDFSGSNGGVAGYGTPAGSRLEALVAWEFGAAPHLVSLLVNGIFERFADLRMIFSGFGVGWLPSLVWRLDSEFKRGRIEMPKGLRELPSQTVARQVRLTVSPEALPDGEAALALLLQELSRDPLLLVGTGPRREEGYDGVAEVLARVPEASRRALAFDNARDFYPRLAEVIASRR
jgi:hypothetical protein